MHGHFAEKAQGSMWKVLAASQGCCRVVRAAEIDTGGKRKSHATLLYPLYVASTTPDMWQVEHSVAFSRAASIALAESKTDFTIALRKALDALNSSKIGTIKEFFSGVSLQEAVHQYCSTAWVEVKQNGVYYALDLLRCMFSKGNISEKIRVAQMQCEDQVVVDLYAGIGYFTIPFSLQIGRFIPICM